MCGCLVRETVEVELQVEPACCHFQRKVYENECSLASEKEGRFHESDWLAPHNHRRFGSRVPKIVDAINVGDFNRIFFPNKSRAVE